MKGHFFEKKSAGILFAILLVQPFSQTLFAQGSSNSSLTALELFEKGNEAQQKGEYFSAIEHYRETLEKNPQFGEVWFNMAKCCYILGDYDLAVEYADKAELYSRNFSQIKNLKGMTLLALGKFSEAREIFLEVLKTYPNDIDARFGLAELDLYNGSLTAAQQRYLDALKRDGTNRKALLSLALVCQEQGNDDGAERYIKQALVHHSGEADVHYLAAYLGARRGKLEEAERYARGAVQIRGDYDKAYELLSQILYAQGRYSEVIDLCDFRIGRNRSLNSAWYLRGLAEKKLGNKSRAIETFNTGLEIFPQDEVMRLALEQIVADELPLEDKRRSQWAKYHIAKASEHNKNFDGPSERYEYQKALSIDPLNQQARQSFADMLSRDNLYELYLKQLEFINENFYTPSQEKNSQTPRKDENTPLVKKTAQQIKNDDTREALESMMTDNLSHKWNIDPFYLDKTRWNIGLYFSKDPVQLIHSDVEETIAVAAKDIFSGTALTAVDVQTEAISGYGEAYRKAREAKRDYFVILRVQETDRSFTLDADIYSARTGTKTSDLHVYRTGNDRVARTLRRFRQAVLDILPIRGVVLENTQGQLLVDLGKNDGITKGAQFDVVKKGSIQTNDTGPGIHYKGNAVLGTFVTEISDEEISEGKFTKKGFYDVLNVGDEIVLTKLSEAESESQEGNAATDTRPAADSEGSPVTPQASAAEREALKESFAAQLRESPLIRMIESIL